MSVYCPTMQPCCVVTFDIGTSNAGSYCSLFKLLQHHNFVSAQHANTHQSIIHV